MCPTPKGLSDNMGRSLFYRSSCQAAGSVILGKRTRTGKIWYGATTSPSEALRRNMKAIRAMDVPYVIMDPGNPKNEHGEDPCRIIAYIGCRVVLKSKLDGIPRGTVGIVCDVTGKEGEESIMIERSGETLERKEKAQVWVKFENTQDPIAVSPFTAKKSKIKKWPIACGPCFHADDWVNQTMDRIMFCPSSGWADNTSHEDAVSTLQLVVGRVSR